MNKKKARSVDILARGRLNLQANQQGYITAQQKDWLKKDLQSEQHRQRQLVTVSGIIFLVVMLVLILMPFVPIPLLAPPILWGSGVVMGYVYLWKQQKPIRDDLAKGKVKSVTGYIDKSITLGYHVRVNDVDYATPPDMYIAFDATQRYTIYYLPISKIVLSAENTDEYSDYANESNHSQTQTSTVLDDDSQLQSGRFGRE